uniref:NTR domain-containing protein n=1 Tax=Callorhinchus milii TaxID=7868 RepID=A0A4W3GZK7_CALMI|eukprot:gi/632987206/ref/XP_007910664.1/ PREDICTED: metalloproteinase inhibitor 3-like [Callorhinchus milii]
MNVKVLAILVVVLSIGRLSHACSCAPAHPQTTFCSSDVVIRGKILERRQQEGDSGHLISYKVKQIKMFKGFDVMAEVENIYTSDSQSLCGFEPDLQNQDRDYYLVGNVHNNKSIYTNLCFFSKPWKELTSSQKVALLGSYAAGCECEIIPCVFMPCSVTEINQCLWTDSLLRRRGAGPQEQRLSCFKQTNGYCKWDSGKSYRKSQLLRGNE